MGWKTVLFDIHSCQVIYNHILYHVYFVFVFVFKILSFDDIRTTYGILITYVSLQGCTINNIKGSRREAVLYAFQMQIPPSFVL